MASVIREGEKKAERHLEFCMLLCRHQLREGLHFLHEHPWGARSWRLKSVADLMSDGRVFTVEGHMCRFGMDTHVRERDVPMGVDEEANGLHDKFAMHCR